MNKKWHLALDLGPLLVFLLVSRLAGILIATGALVIATLISLTITYIAEKRLALMPLASGIFVTLFGGLTWYLNDDFYIKIKPTCLNLLLAALLFGGLLIRKNILKILLGDALTLREEGWRKLSLRWGLFFMFLAILNECIWRNFSTDFWINFKVFGMFSCSFIFTMSQVPLIQKYWVEENKIDN